MPREPVALIDPSIIRSDGFLVLCSWCKKVELSGNWVEAEEAMDRLKLFEQEAIPQVTHGVCPPCTAAVKEEINQFESR